MPVAEKEQFVKVYMDVFEPLCLRWRHSPAALKVVFYIVRWSWGWKEQAWTKKPLKVSEVASSTGLNRATVHKAIIELKKHGIITVRNDDHARINRSILAQLADTLSPNGDQSVAKWSNQCRQTETEVSPFHNGQPPESFREHRVARDDRQQRHFIDIIHNVFSKKLKEKTSTTPDSALVETLLRECEKADLHPLDLLEIRAQNPVGLIRAACKDPGRYRETVRPFYKFAEEYGKPSPEMQRGLDAMISQVRMEG